jgi:endonuclease/exonuclease/phosphatase (EEP) superfamily protein YafD
LQAKGGINAGHSLVPGAFGASFGMNRYWPLWAGVVPLALWALIRLLGLDAGTPVAPLMAATPVAAVTAFLFAGLCVALRNWAAAVLTGLAFACLAAVVLPRAFGQGEDLPPNATRMTVLSANLYLGRAEPENLVDLAAKHRPDLLVLQELTPELAIALRRAGLRRLFPYAAVALPAHGFGRGVYSRLPLRRYADPTGHPSKMPPLGVTLHGGRTVRLIDVHPHPPKPGKVATWENALSRLPSAGSGPPWLLVGDFNATLDQSALQAVLARGYRDAGEVTGNGLAPTWPANEVIPPFLTIDHILADRRIGIAAYRVERLEGTDHRAIFGAVFLH